MRDQPLNSSAGTIPFSQHGMERSDPLKMVRLCNRLGIGFMDWSHVSFDNVRSLIWETFTSSKDPPPFFLSFAIMRQKLNTNHLTHQANMISYHLAAASWEVAERVRSLISAANNAFLGMVLGCSHSWDHQYVKLPPDSLSAATTSK